MFGAFLSSLLAVMCFAVYIPIFLLAMRHLTTGEVKVRRPIEGGVEIKTITGYRATIYALGQFLIWFPAVYAALMVIQTRNVLFLFLGVIFSIAIGYVNTLIAQRMKGEINLVTFDQMGFKFNLQNFAKRNFNVQTQDADEPEKPKRGLNNADIEDAVFYDVPPDDVYEEKRKNDDDVDL